MSRRGLIGLVVGLALVGLGVIAWITLVETEEDRVLAITHDVSGEVGLARVRRARARWVNLDAQPFTLRALGVEERFEAGDEDALDTRTREAIAPLAGSRNRVIQRRIEIEGDRALVNLRVLSDRRGMGNLELVLRRHGRDFWLSELRLTR